MWILCTGAPWRDLPERYGSWKTAYTSFSRWTATGVWKAAINDLLVELDEAGKVDNDLWCVDGTVIRAHRAASGARKGARNQAMARRGRLNAWGARVEA